MILPFSVLCRCAIVQQQSSCMLCCYCQRLPIHFSSLLKLLFPRRISPTAVCRWGPILRRIALYCSDSFVCDETAGRQAAAMGCQRRFSLLVHLPLCVSASNSIITPLHYHVPVLSTAVVVLFSSPNKETGNKSIEKVNC